ncbi:MAG: PQQ-binding-like beta-propeller repeat protein [Gemmatimonadaceae bacterium]|jgi:outer membrane protein assembly factor BamB|nr:PQQ-binding-like beta-propeller repeat protein [Gemmatimonadaceae bacterium]
MTSTVRALALCRARASLIALAWLSTGCASPVASGDGERRLTLWRGQVASHIGFGSLQFHGAPVVLADSTVVLTAAESIFVFDARTGRLRWRRRLPFLARSHGLVADGTRGLTVVGETGAARIETDSGKITVTWQGDGADRAFAPIPIAGGGIAVIRRKGTILRFDRDGRFVGEDTFVAAALSAGEGVRARAVRGDTVFLLTTEDSPRGPRWQISRLRTVDLAARRIVATSQDPSDSLHISFDAVLADSLLIFPSSGEEGGWIAWRTRDGTRAWTVRTELPFVGPTSRPVLRGDTLWLGGSDNRVYRVHAPTGRVEARSPARLTAPVSQVAVCAAYVLASTSTEDVVPLDRRTLARLGRAPRDLDGFASHHAVETPFAKFENTVIAQNDNGTVAAYRCDDPIVGGR